MEEIKILYKYDLLIINRSFWPTYPLLGDALLKISEEVSKSIKTGVVFQKQKNFQKQIKLNKRGNKVNFFPSLFSINSDANFFERIIDTIFFLIWVIICLIRTRPKKIYISTDPPIVIPFFVSIYCLIFKAKFIYHIQDIHPEATDAIYKINKFILKILRGIDNFVINRASILITLNDTMEYQIRKRSDTKKKIIIIENPSCKFELKNFNSKKKRGFTFIGNLGRMQRIPLICDAINHYCNSGGKLTFAFVGGGIYSSYLNDLANNCKLVKYYGFKDIEEASMINASYEWALLPIEDKVTNFSFPSKVSSYVYCGAKILAICSKTTSVAKFVKNYDLGIVVEPTVEKLADIFFSIEYEKLDVSFVDLERKELKKKLDFEFFVDNIKSLILKI